MLFFFWSTNLILHFFQSSKNFMVVLHFARIKPLLWCNGVLNFDCHTSAFIYLLLIIHNNIKIEMQRGNYLDLARINFFQCYLKNIINSLLKFSIKINFHKTFGCPWINVFLKNAVLTSNVWPRLIVIVSFLNLGFCQEKAYVLLNEMQRNWSL